MYLLIIRNNAEIKINGIKYRFDAGGQNNDKSGTFIFKTDDPTAVVPMVTISTPEDTVLHRSDSLRTVVETLTSSPW